MNSGFPNQMELGPSPKQPMESAPLLKLYDVRESLEAHPTQFGRDVEKVGGERELIPGGLPE
jgi:hypothetical protein